MALLDRFRLDDRVAIVTGSGSGLGVAIAKGLAEAGADIVLAGRRLDALERTAELVEKAGRRAACVEVDISDPEQCALPSALAVETFGRLDVLVNNAGLGTVVPALRETPEGWRAVMETNVQGSFFMAQEAAARMQPGSSIINISSIMAWHSVGSPQAAYMASKAALLGMTRDLAQQWTGRKGIRVNAIAPGIFQTEMTDHFFDDLMAAQGPRIPAGRAGHVDELASAVVFLAGDGASYITGETLVVDGGRTIL